MRYSFDERCSSRPKKLAPGSEKVMHGAIGTIRRRVIPL
jgi:hypothetical protein